MSVSDPISDMLTKIRNASMAKFEKVDISSSKLKVEIVKILKNEGYIKTFKKIKYDGDSKPVLHGLRRLSKPGRRVYTGYKSMPRVFNGYGTLIVTTSKGVITGKKAAEQQVGGELICSIW
jgi:small subunit ribosomal protein S8